MFWIFFGIIAPLLIFAAIIALAVRRGLEMRQLCEQGIRTTGRVAEKRSLSGAGAGAKQKKIVIHYQDQAGLSHSRTSSIPLSVFEQYAVNDRIEVVYLPTNPSISAPGYLVDQCREALRKKIP